MDQTFFYRFKSFLRPLDKFNEKDSKSISFLHLFKDDIMNELQDMGYVRFLLNYSHKLVSG